MSEKAQVAITTEVDGCSASFSAALKVAQTRNGAIISELIGAVGGWLGSCLMEFRMDNKVDTFREGIVWE